MWLIHTRERKLYDFVGDKIPRYAILSHTWEGHETSFAEFQQQSYSFTIPENSKVSQSCRIAASHGLDFLWVDTCCIDKRSSAELSEAINSMYQWYREAEVCYVYLADISVKAAMQDKEAKELKASRWFTRGWTLQELVAPHSILFFDQDWIQLGTKTSLQSHLSEAAHISEEHLFYPHYASVAIKMSWAAYRSTTRTEDIAYCLLGLFDVNMPLLYGEGFSAFERLQQAIMASSADDSIFAWFPRTPKLLYHGGMLASHPAEFSQSGTIVESNLKFSTRASYYFTRGSVETTLWARRHKDTGVRMHHDDVLDALRSDFCTGCEIWEVPLACAEKSKMNNPVRLQLHRWGSQSMWRRCTSGKGLDIFDCIAQDLSGFDNAKFRVSLKPFEDFVIESHRTPGTSLSRLNYAFGEGIRISFTESARRALPTSIYLPYSGKQERTSASYVFKNHTMAFGGSNGPAFMLQGFSERSWLRLSKTAPIGEILPDGANDHCEEVLKTFIRPLELFTYEIGPHLYLTVKTASDWHLVYGPIHATIDVTELNIDRVL